MVSMISRILCCQERGDKLTLTFKVQYTCQALSMRPALCLSDQKIPENLHASDVFELFGIDEIALQRGRFHVVEHLNEACIFVDQIVG